MKCEISNYHFSFTVTTTQSMTSVIGNGKSHARTCHKFCRYTKYNDMYTSASQILIHFKMSWNLPHACFAVTMSITTMINEIMKDGVQGKQCY